MSAAGPALIKLVDDGVAGDKLKKAAEKLIG